MKAIFTIATRDFRSYFHSIKGWAIFWFALFFAGLFFSSFVNTYISIRQQTPTTPEALPQLSQLLTAIFHNIHFIFLLIVPATTMASFAEERHSQTLRLLQSSPVTTLQIVLGKFFGCLSILTLVLLTTMVYPMFTVVYGNPDIGQIFSSYLGLFLLMASQITLGLWISSMCKNQFLAFLFTMGVIFFLMILNWIAPNLAAQSNLEYFIKYAASTTHLDPIFKGIISVSDITYFVSFATIFLYLAYSSLDSLRWR